MTKFANPSFNSPANNGKYRDNYDRVFGKKSKKKVKICKWHDGDHDPGCSNKCFTGRDYCDYHLEKMGGTIEHPATD